MCVCVCVLEKDKPYKFLSRSLTDIFNLFYTKLLPAVVLILLELYSLIQYITNCYDVVVEFTRI